jgi:hypothetical protein
MNKILKVAILLFLVQNGYSQSKCGQIFDLKTSKPVSYAAISCDFSKNFAYSDDIGKFCIDNLSPKDTISISALGYKKKTLTNTLFIKSDSIFIENSPVELETVTIKLTKNKYSVQTVGFYKNSFFQLKNEFIPNSNMKIAVFIKKSTSKNTVISKVFYRLKPHTSAIVNFYRVRFRLYKNGETDLPENDLLLTNITADVSPQQPTIEENILRENIAMPENGIWLGIETIGFVDKEGIYQPLKTGQAGKVYYKNSKKRKIERADDLSPHFVTNREMKKSSVKKFASRKNWTDFAFLDDKLTFMFGMEILVDK